MIFKAIIISENMLFITDSVSVGARAKIRK